MPAFTQKTSRARTGQRRAHHALKKTALAYDADGNPYLPHHASSISGKYKGRQMLNVTKRAMRKAKKKA